MRTLTLIVPLLAIALIASVVVIVFALDNDREYTPLCQSGACPVELGMAHSGAEVRYRPTQRFTVFLDAQKYPKSELTCAPKGVIGEISNLPQAPAGKYAARFEALSPGTCVLQDRDFSVRITVTS